MKEIYDAVKKLPEYQIEIGVISIHSKRKEKVRIGLTNAELMFIHENGSPLRHIPARPVLQMTLDYANRELLQPTITKCIDAFLDSGLKESAIERELKKLCIRMENYAREIIYSNDGRLAPNAPSVAAKKKGNHPLFDTGQLARSITCQLVKI